MVGLTACGEKEEANCPELTGRVVLPKEPGYEKARLVSNYYPSKNVHPEVIVYCQNATDVQNAVKWARCRKVPIRVRSGGHNHEGFSTGTGVIVIDVSEMKQLHIDKEKKIITVQPGVTGGELYARLYSIGLTQVGGTCADVGVSGLILTGGMGPLLRRHGMSCDSLLEFEMVNANGEIVRATKDNEHKDLFWATQGGGGGNFGIITSLTLQVYPADTVTWFNIGWNWEQPVEEIIAAWQEFFQKDDRRWFSHLDVWSKAFPTEKFQKQPIKVLGVFWGTPEEARKELAPLLKIGKPSSDVIKTVTWDKAIKEFEEATAVFVTDKPEYKSTGAYAMKVLPADAIKKVRETLEKSTAPLLNFLMFSMGGASAEVAPGDTAYFYRKAKFFLFYTDQWMEGNDKKQIAALDTFRQDLMPYAQGDYIGNPDRNLKDYLKDYYGDNVERLRCVKRRYDPDNIFKHEQSIPPAPANCPHM